MIMVDWCTLPSDLLIAIALKLDIINNDLIYFSAVCHSWNDVSTIIKRDLNSSATPWLLLADPNPNNAVCSGRSEIIDINNIKGFKLNIPQAYLRRCFGSAYGWIVMIGSDDRQVSLFNPITKAQLTLPSLASLPVLRNSSMRYEIMQIAGPFSIWEPIQFTVLKAIVLKIDDNDFVVMVIYYHSLRSDDNPLTSKNHSLALSRPGDRTWRWTKVITSGENVPPHVIDVVYLNGLVLILHLNGLITCCEISALVNFSPSSPVYANKPYCSIVNPDFINLKLGYCEECYMIELAGDLLLVQRYRAKSEAVMKHFYTCDFKVYKLDHSGDEKCWTIVEELGDYMVFVGNNSAMSVHKSKLPNCKHNAIYFTDDIKLYWSEPKPRLQDIGLFDMASREFKRYNNIYTTFRPLWFMPKF